MDKIKTKIKTISKLYAHGEKVKVGLQNRLFRYAASVMKAMRLANDDTTVEVDAKKFETDLCNSADKPYKCDWWIAMFTKLRESLSQTKQAIASKDQSKVDEARMRTKEIIAMFYDGAKGSQEFMSESESSQV